MNADISVVFNTLNEERNLPYALRSVAPWAAEIIVVDMHSDDRTVAIARQFGAKVYLHEKILFFDKARQYALSKVTNEWVLILDADEIVPPDLARHLIAMSRAQDADVVMLPRRNYLFGAPMQGTGWEERQDAVPRFFKRNAVQITDRMHDFYLISDGCKTICPAADDFPALIHFNYLTISHFLEKMNRYTDIEAVQAQERGESFSYLVASWLMFKEIANRFIRKKGFKDGWRGWTLSFFMAGYRLITQVKLKELAEVGSKHDVDNLYKDIAEQTLTGYENWEMRDVDR